MHQWQLNYRSGNDGDEQYVCSVCGIYKCIIKLNETQNICLYGEKPPRMDSFHIMGVLLANITNRKPDVEPDCNEMIIKSVLE